MKQLIIIGAGGFGREIHNMLPECHGYGDSFLLKGFINDISDALDGFDGYAPIIGTIQDYVPEPDDVFICAIGDVAGRKKCVHRLKNRGAKFINLLHTSSYIGRNTTIGEGCILFNGVMISCDCKIGDYTIIQADCIIGHDVQIGHFNQFHPRVFVGGKAVIGDEVHIGPYALIHPCKKLADQSTVGGGSFVIRNVKPGQTVYGNPAKVLNSLK